jgi:hypothetical protein
MRDKNLSYLVFEQQFDKESKRRFQSSKSKIKILRDAVIDSPTFLSDFEVVLPSDYRRIRGLCLYWERLPEILRYEVFLLLENRIKYFDTKKQKELIFLMNLKCRNIFLFKSQRFTSHQIFGNFLQDGVEALIQLKLRKKSTTINLPQRKRGYDDKGTLRSYDIWMDKWKPSSDFSLTEAQNEKERKQNRHWRSVELIFSILENLMKTEEISN